MRARAVIGANYGDEGKGRTVDWLAAMHGPSALLVRSNGGAQAGHTVTRPDGARHVFHHIGSGAFRGARTHLSQFMVSHPILFSDELEQLVALGVTPIVSADPRGFVTTPWDMMLNQAIEVARGGQRHGSCGLGFGETVGRCQDEEYALTVADLWDVDLHDKLLAIRDEWLPARLDTLVLGRDAEPMKYALSDTVFERFINQCAAFAAQVALRDDAALGSEESIIFEAAQGLLLDQNAPGFPYLTRSDTGMVNIAVIAAEAGIAQIDPVYVTRCYLTRHGRGPMEDERPIEHWYQVEDQTNRPNPWQENLRFGLLDPVSLGQRIREDIAKAACVKAPTLAVTCMDHVSADLVWLESSKVVEGTREAFASALISATRLPLEVTFSSAFNSFSTNKI